MLFIAISYSLFFICIYFANKSPDFFTYDNLMASAIKKERYKQLHTLWLLSLICLMAACIYSIYHYFVNIEDIALYLCIVGFLQFISIAYTISRRNYFIEMNELGDSNEGIGFIRFKHK